jgi:hypothetical protein
MPDGIRKIIKMNLCKRNSLLSKRFIKLPCIPLKNNYKNCTHAILVIHHKHEIIVFLYTLSKDYKPSYTFQFQYELCNLVHGSKTMEQVIPFQYYKQKKKQNAKGST